MQVVLASHGRLAEGMKDTLGIIFGELPDLTTLCAYVDPDVTLAQQVKDVLARKVPGEEMLVVTDLFGGSVNNEFMAALAENDFTLICGMNIPLLVEILSDANPDPAAVRAAVDSCKDTIMICNDLLDDGQDCGEDF